MQILEQRVPQAFHFQSVPLCSCSSVGVSPRTPQRLLTDTVCGARCSPKHLVALWTCKIQKPPVPTSALLHGVPVEIK